MNIEKNYHTVSVSGNDTDISLIRLICRDGFSLTLSSLGASIRQIEYPAGPEHLKNIALSFAEDSAYLSNPLYAGATLAPAAGRISRGLLPLGGRICRLSKNENNCHTLHGGFQNASFQNWQLLSADQKEDSASVSFGCVLPDGLDGFPGNRRIKAIYTLTEAHRLTLQYEAVSDQDTYFNLSNHCYFNLSGDFSRPAVSHLLQIRADRYIRNAPDFIPEEIASVAGTPFDFRQPRSLEAQQKTYPDDIQLAWNRGYNHGFLLNHGTSPALAAASPQNSSSAPAEASVFSHTGQPDLICTLPGSSLRLSVSSDAPCMILYSGGYIEEGLSLAEGQRSVPSCALAFEFQDYPDAPGGHDFPYHITPAGKCWERTICYQFDTLS